MDIDTHEIEDRIKGQFDLGHATLFWEDEPGEYAEIVDALDLGNGAIVDVTGAELSGKRTILRERPARSLVIYRSGPKPRPQDDFLYDVKLAATPFTCKMEGIWASECGVPMPLAAVLSEHGSFFNSKERRGALAATPLPKGDERALRLAMLAACAGSRAEAPRDAVRDVVKRLLVDLGRGQGKTLRTIRECGLAATLWSEVLEVVGYAAPAGEDPTPEDLALRMLKARCASLAHDGAPSRRTPRAYSPTSPRTAVPVIRTTRWHASTPMPSARRCRQASAPWKPSAPTTPSPSSMTGSSPTCSAAPSTARCVRRTPAQS